MAIALISFAVSSVTTAGQETELRSLNTGYVLSDSDLRLMKNKAFEGDAGSAFQIYLHYSLGKYDSICAFGWLQIAANKGHAVAQYNLGSTYMDVALFKNIKLAVFWLKEAEKNGEEMATERLKELEESESNKIDKK